MHEATSELIEKIRQYAADGKTRGERRPEIDALLTGEYTLDGIAKRVRPLRNKHENHTRLTRERIRQYLEKTGQHETFKENRKKFTRRHLYEQLVGTLANYVLKKTGSRSWTVRKAVEYRLRTQVRKNNIPLENLVKLFRIYSRARNSGERITLSGLAAKSGLNHITTASYALEALGLEPVWNHRERRITPKGKKEAVLRAYYTDLPLPDAAYFLSLPCHTVLQNIQRRYGNTGSREKCIKRFGGPKTGVEVLTYRAASQIYQASDWGWSEDDIVYCFDGKRRMVRYAMEHRHEVGPKIISLLDVLYPGAMHDRPYLSP